MFEALRGGATGRKGDAARHRPGDPLAKTILFDLLITTAGFLMTVVAVVAAVQGLSLH
jgi:hypothetical protein